MDGMVLGLFPLATFVGGVVAGLAGFAMSLVVSGIWPHILTPIQTVTLIVGYMRTVVGLVLVLYSTYGLARPAIKPVQAEVPADFCWCPGWR